MNIGGNKFKQLPTAVYRLRLLKELYLHWNENLLRIEKEVWYLTELETLECDRCASLEYPPYAVCKQGLSAIQHYLSDTMAAEGIEVTTVPVPVHGYSEAGKSSIKESLKRGRC